MGVVVGRGSEYNFQAIRETGRAMIQRLSEEDDLPMPQTSNAMESQGSQARPLGPGRMDMLTKRLQNLDQRGGFMMLKDQDAKGSLGAASAQATHRKIQRRPY